MQAVDDRESRLRNALVKLEEKDGRILRDTIHRLVTVSSLQILLSSTDHFADERGDGYDGGGGG